MIIKYYKGYLSYAISNSKDYYFDNNFNKNELLKLFKNKKIIYFDNHNIYIENYTVDHHRIFENSLLTYFNVFNKFKFLLRYYYVNVCFLFNDLEYTFDDMDKVIKVYNNIKSIKK